MDWMARPPPTLRQVQVTWARSQLANQQSPFNGEAQTLDSSQPIRAQEGHYQQMLTSITVTLLWQMLTPRAESHWWAGEAMKLKKFGILGKQRPVPLPLAAPALTGLEAFALGSSNAHCSLLF